MRALDGQSFLNISATPPNFNLEGGLYGVDITATWDGGSVTINKLAADGSTWVAVATTMSADGTATFYAPAGVYQVAVETATAVYINIRRIPGE